MAITTATGKASKNAINVSDAAFGQAFNEALIHQVVTSYLAGGRAGTRAQKSRSQVSGGGSKPWRQKGSGRARAGSIRSPLWRGGGTTFAAVPADHSQKVNRKMYRGALRSIVSELARQERVVVVEQFGVDAPKTKALIDKLKVLGLDDVLVVVDGIDEPLYLAARNLHRVALCDARHVDPVSLLRHEKVLMTVDAVRKLEEMLA